MPGFIAKLFGGNKSEKDIKKIAPLVEQINQYVTAYGALSNDELRAKTPEFKQRIKEFLAETDNRIAELNTQAENLPFSDIGGKDALYTEIDELKKKRDDKIEEVLDTLLPEAFAVVKETATLGRESNRDRE